MGAALKAPAADRTVTAKDNNPPDPFGAIKTHIDDLLMEARHWADGAAVETPAQAEEIERLVDELRQAEKAAEVVRKAEVKPFDDAKAEVQARFNPLIAPLTNKEPGSVPKAIRALLNALTPWRNKLAEEERARAEALRLEAEAKARAAQEAAKAAAASSDLAANDAAEEVFAEARQASQEAARAEKTAGVGLGLRTVWTPALNDRGAALRFYYGRDPTGFDDFVLQLAKRDVTNGARTIPGFTITSEQKAF